jgi:hypothetical protein
MIHLLRRWRLLAPLCALLVMASLGSCGLMGEDGRTLLRSDPPIRGYESAMRYSINSNPDGTSEVNQITWQGVNGNSPFPLQTTTFGKGANSRTQDVQISGANGEAITVLGMNKWDMNVGMTDYLKSQIATYEQRDAQGNRICGAKVRLIFQPNGFQFLKDDDYRRAWDALFYYSVPCAGPAAPTEGEPSAPVAPDTELDLSQAEMIALVINQQFTPRLTGDPIVFNRGHSVTIVGGRASRELRGGWWQSPAGLMNGSNVVIDLVKDLDRNEWLDFSDSGNGGLVYSAGDADVYLSLNRLFLNRRDAYMVNFRADPSDGWTRVLVDPVYNKEWNDFSSNYTALTNSDAPNIDELINEDTGLPKDLDPESDSAQSLKEIEESGCQNCPNAELEQIRFVDVTEGSRTYEDTLYAMTIRGWAGSTRSLVMFGDLPGSPKEYYDRAEDRANELGLDECPIQRNDKGEREDRQYTDKECALLLREGGLFDLLTSDASTLGLDVVGQFSVHDNSTWVDNCTGSGESTTCSPVATDRKLDASYMFTNTDEGLRKAWTVLQLLGEVGTRGLGLSYAYELYGGSGLNFAMAQPHYRNTYWTDITADPANEELLFSLDARALQLPATLGEARTILYGSPRP